MLYAGAEQHQHKRNQARSEDWWKIDQPPMRSRKMPEARGFASGRIHSTSFSPVPSQFSESRQQQTSSFAPDRPPPITTRGMQFRNDVLFFNRNGQQSKFSNVYPLPHTHQRNLYNPAVPSKEWYRAPETRGYSVPFGARSRREMLDSAGGSTFFDDSRDSELSQQFLRRAAHHQQSTTPPPRTNESPSERDIFFREKRLFLKERAIFLRERESFMIEKELFFMEKSELLRRQENSPPAPAHNDGTVRFQRSLTLSAEE